MATRSLFLSKCKTQFPTLFSRLFLSTAVAEIPKPVGHPTTAFCTLPKKRSPKLVNFSAPSDCESDSDTPSPAQKPKLPPPYNPFSKDPVIEEPSDPKNLQEALARLRSDGLMNSAAKMFDGLSQDGLTHEALQLFSAIKDKGQMPDVIAHTAVMEAYVDAGRGKEAHRVYLRMLATGVAPNAYTYKVVMRGLVDSGDVKEANKIVAEMAGQGMTVNAGTCVAVFEGLLAAGLQDQATEMLEMLKAKGLAPEEDKLSNVIRNKRGSVYRSLMNVLYGK